MTISLKTNNCCPPLAKHASRGGCVNSYQEGDEEAGTTQQQTTLSGPGSSSGVLLHITYSCGSSSSSRRRGLTGSERNGRRSKRPVGTRPKVTGPSGAKSQKPACWQLAKPSRQPGPYYKLIVAGYATHPQRRVENGTWQILRGPVGFT